MRIVHVVLSLAPEGGGLPVAALQLARAVAALGHSVTLLAGAANTTILSDGTAGELPASLEVLQVATSGPLQALTAHAFAEPLARLLPACDVLHLHGAWEPPIVRAALAAQRAGVPFIVCSHGMWSPWSLQQRRVKKVLAWHLLYARVLRRAAAFHCLSANEERFAEARGLAVPLVRIPNGVDLAALTAAPSANEFLAQHPALASRSFFLFLGRFHRSKGLELLLSAYQNFVQRGGAADLVLIGPDGGDGTLQSVRQRVASEALGRRVHLLGPVFGPEKYAAIAASTALVQASWQEAFSMTIAEGLASARPVVITESCQFDDVVEANAGWVVPAQAEAFAEALLQVERDPQTAEAMGQNGARLVREKYTWPQVAATAVRAYEGAVTRNRRT